MLNKIRQFLIQVIIETVAVYVLGTAIIIILSELKIIDTSKLFGSQKQSIPSFNSEMKGQLEGTFVSTKLSNQLEGTIIELDKNGGISPQKIPYELKFVLKGKGENPTTIYFTSKMLDVISVSNLVDGQNVPISLSKLQVGDKIIFNSIWDFDNKSKIYKFVQGSIQKL